MQHKPVFLKSNRGFLVAVTAKVSNRARMSRYSSKVRQWFRNGESNQLPAFSSIGGYTIIYLTKKDEVVCAKCANDPIGNDIHVQDCGTYDEGPDTACDVCECIIKSSYGDPDNESDENNEDENEVN